MAALPPPVAPAWLHRAAEIANFRVVGSNDAAWFVEGRGKTRYYLWANRARPDLPLLSRLAGVPVYGTKVRVAWRAQGLTVWAERGPRTDSELPPRGRLAELVVVTRNLPMRYRPIRMMRMPYGPLRKCRSSKLLAPVCPRIIVRIPGWRTYPSYGNPVTDTFGIESGGSFPGKPELNRPPAMFHLELSAARHGHQVLTFAWPHGAAVAPRDGLLHLKRTGPILLRGGLVLAPDYPRGGSQGGHLIYRRRAQGVTYYLGLHAWEPFTETVAVLRRIVRGR